MNRFSRTLNEAIQESGLVLTEIAARCEALCSVRVDPSYLSKLRHGACLPPSDRLARALAMALGQNPMEYALEAYVGRAPEDLRERLNALR